jgi:hypothetical protein
MDRPEARASLEESLAVFKASGDGYFEAMALSILGRVALGEGDLDEAARLSGEAMSLLMVLGDRKELPYSLYQLCVIHRLRSEPVHAAAFGSRALAVASELEQPLLTSKALMHLAAVASDAGTWEDAARLFSTSDVIREGIGAATLTPWERSVGVGDLVAATEEALGSDAYASARSEGAALSIEEAAELGYHVAGEIGAHNDPRESSD